MPIAALANHAGYREPAKRSVALTTKDGIISVMARNTIRRLFHRFYEQHQRKALAASRAIRRDVLAAGNPLAVEGRWGLAATNPTRPQHGTSKATAPRNYGKALERMTVRGSNCPAPPRSRTVWESRATPRLFHFGHARERIPLFAGGVQR